MKEALKHIITKNDFTAQALTNKIIANAVQNVVFDLHTDKTKEEIIDNLRTGLDLKSIAYTEIIETGFSYAVENGLIKARGKKFNISTAQRTQINRQRQNRDIRLQEVIEQHFNDCDANCNDIRSWLIDSLEAFFKSYSREWISDITRRTTSISTAKSSIFDLIKKRTIASTKFNLSEFDKQNLPQKFVDFVNTNSSNVNSLLAEYGLLAFSSSLLSAATSIDRLTIDAFSDCTFILDTNILFNLNLESGIYYGYLPAIKSAFDSLNINAMVLPCTVDEYEHVLTDQSRNISKTLEIYPNKIGLLQAMKDNAIVQTALKRHCQVIEDFETFIKQIYNIDSFSEDILRPTILKLPPECIAIEKEIENDTSTQTSYNDFFTDFTSRPKRPAPLEHDVKLLKIAHKLREDRKLFILTDDYPLHRYTLEHMSQKDSQPLAIRIITFISLLALQKDEQWNNDNNYDRLFSVLLRKELFPSEKILTFDDLGFMYEHDQAIAKLSDDDIIRIGRQYNSKRLSEDASDTQIFLSREIAKTNQGYYADFTQAKAELHTTQAELLRQKSTASTASAALRKRIEREVGDEADIRCKSIIKWRIVIPIIIAILLLFGFGALAYFDLIDNLTNICALIVTLIGASIWEFVFAWPKLAAERKSRNEFIKKETERRLMEELNQK